MYTATQIQITKAVSKHRTAILTLLAKERLPVDDLPTSLDHFFVALAGETVVGAIGLEIYDNFGLLRSMVVNSEFRNQRIASRLVKNLEDHARSLGMEIVYLLTETAPAYFESKGYQRITRDGVPATLHASSEFSHVCPVSAVVMTKQLSQV